ncbi:MAG: DEAD/DEAH box helicase [Candidatus Margulisiibacteriota bacterium]|nr:DEAD/DEAH box helicase [Candidatus Margulisiibacteriota bacterium]
MNRINFYLTFLFNSKNRLMTIVEAKMNEEEINLSKSSFMLFLYNHETDINEKDLDFSYRLTKYLKKLQIGNDIHDALPQESDVGWFLSRAQELGVNVLWRQIFDNNTSDFKPLIFDALLPLEIEMKQDKNKIQCVLNNRLEWLQNPLLWMPFPSDKGLYCFCNGYIKKNPSKSFINYLDNFLDRNLLIFEGNQAIQFIQRVYSPNKNLLNWIINLDLQQFLPSDDSPTPRLDVIYENNTLMTTLSYNYGNENVLPQDTTTVLKDATTGRLYKRQKDMEDIYQNDLMELFLAENLPFLLENPGHIAKFLDQIVPTLKEREWLIHSTVNDFNVLDTPIDLTFGVESPKQDWFEFSQTTTIDGQELSFTEISRLLVENQGYIKTSSGYVKVSEESQQELKTLNSFHAFTSKKSFNMLEFLPLLGITSVEGKDSSSNQFIENFKNFHRSENTLGNDFEGELRDYQTYGVKWLSFLNQYKFGGILADDMGLGKTVQTIAFTTSIEQTAPYLIIGPTNVIYNWEKEIDKFTKRKKTIVYGGSNREKLIPELTKSNYVIISFGILKNDIDLLKNIPFEAIFIDEAQHIKNPKTQVSKAVKQLNAKFRIAMTGTPIENYIQDLWNIFDFAMPNYLGKYSQFENDIKNNRKDQIKTKIKPFILRREKREVLDSLPEKTEIIVKCDMTPNQEKLYKTVLDAAKKGIKTIKGKQERLSIFTALLKLRQVCIHPQLLKEVGASSIESSKFELAKEKIKELIDEGHKIVMFSQFTEMLDIMGKWTTEESFYTERIDGSVSAKARMEAVDRFQASEKPGMFLISLKAGGVGLNLTAADYVIHLDPWWNPAIESQATDRVHRMGQKNKVIVYKLITKGTIEEKIQELQESKKQLLSEIIDIDTASEKSLNFDEIKNLLLD